jgi:uncharacterized delta-60 repeat protein
VLAVTEAGDAQASGAQSFRSGRAISSQREWGLLDVPDMRDARGRAGWAMILVYCVIASGESTMGQSGSVDPTFNPGGGNNSGFDADTFAMATQGDGKVVVVGSFTKVGRTSRNGIARLHSDGSLDTTFDPGSGANGLVESVALTTDGRVLLVGRFSTFNGQARHHVARLDTGGTLDTGFRPDPNDIVVSVMPGLDGKVLVGGAFTAVGGVGRRYVARLNDDGSVDGGFNTGSGPDKPVHAMALGADGRLIVCGQFTSINGVRRMRVARLMPDGSVDLGFDPGDGPNYAVTACALQADGRIIIGSTFTEVAGVSRTFIARLNPDGGLDATFTPGIALAWGGVMALCADPAGGVIVGGEFETIDGLSRVGIARLLNDGNLDAAFDPGSGVANADTWSPLVRGVALQADGKVLIGGRFTSVNGTKLNRLARLRGDAGGVVEFAAKTQQVEETAGESMISIRRTGASGGGVSVNVRVAGGTATVEEDFFMVERAVTFGPGETEKTLRIGIKSDALVEEDETIELALENPVGGVQLGAHRTASLTVVDRLEVARLEFTSVERMEGGGVRLVLSAPSGTTCVLQEWRDGWASIQTNVASGGGCLFEPVMVLGAWHGVYRAMAPSP